MKILKTNWINILGVFAATFICVFGNAFFLHSTTFIQAIFGALLSVCLYGLIFWGLFVASLLILDSLLIVKHPTNIRIKLFVEWLLIGSPFIYWVIKYQEWVFLVAVLTFLITQLLREKLIIKAVKA